MYSTRKLGTVVLRKLIRCLKLFIIYYNCYKFCGFHKIFRWMHNNEVYTSFIIVLLFKKYYTLLEVASFKHDLHILLFLLWLLLFVCDRVREKLVWINSQFVPYCYEGMELNLSDLMAYPMRHLDSPSFYFYCNNKINEFLNFLLKLGMEIKIK